MKKKFLFYIFLFITLLYKNQNLEGYMVRFQPNLVQGIILAAGKSSRFYTSNTKLSFPIAGQEMIMYPIKLLINLGIDTTLVLGYQKDSILNIINRHNLVLSEKLNYIEQKELNGTGGAILCTKDLWKTENILILNGDMPLVTEEIIENLVYSHENSDATISLITSTTNDPRAIGYGRVINRNNIISIVEAKDFKFITGEEPTEYRAFNAGIYLIKRAFLEQFLPTLAPSPITGEIYLTELVKKASETGKLVQTIEVDFDIIRGINTLEELSIAEKVKKTEIIRKWMGHGVYFELPETIQIDKDVLLSPNCKIGANSQLLGTTKIGENCFIEPFSIISNSDLGNNVVVKSNTVIKDSIINTGAEVGPFAHIQNSKLDSNTIIGNFVETNRSSIGHGTKAKHLTYLGDAIVGSGVNIGAGTITCNYNGVSKKRTIIKDGAFIGSNSSLVAPLTIETGALVAAGSVITKDVPEDTLAIARPNQINKENYVSKLKEKYSSENSK